MEGRQGVWVEAEGNGREEEGKEVSKAILTVL